MVGIGEVSEFEILDVDDTVVLLQFVCSRSDKINANSSLVIAATIDNYVNPVTEDALVKACLGVK